MKKNFIFKLALAMAFIIFLPLLITYTTTAKTTTTTKPITQPALQGWVKKSPTEGLQYVRVKSNDGYETCSQGLPSLGWYSFQLKDDTDKIVTFTKQGFKLKLEPVTGLGVEEIRRLDVNLTSPTPNNEISGHVGVDMEGITVKLIQVGCTDVEIARTKTCSDGKYSFYGMLDSNGTAVIDIPSGTTYRVEPCCSVCTFSPTSIPNIQIPNSSLTKYNFTAQCNAGACQPCP